MQKFIKKTCYDNNEYINIYLYYYIINNIQNNFK